MSDVHDWSKRNLGAIDDLIKSFYAGEPAREFRSVQDASALIRLSGEIDSCLNTLSYIMKNKSAVSDLKDLVVSGDTPDNAYFGPTPSLSGVGLGSAIGSAASLGLAVLEVFKGARAESKFSASVSNDPSEIKREMMHKYSAIALTLQKLTHAASLSERSADKLHSAGLNVYILNDAWRVVRGNQWLVFAA